MFFCIFLFFARYSTIGDYDTWQDWLAILRSGKLWCCGLEPTVEDVDEAFDRFQIIDGRIELRRPDRCDWCRKEQSIVAYLRGEKYLKSEHILPYTFCSHSCKESYERGDGIPSSDDDISSELHF